jgi:cleavage and polyadenylation specificity factor subunit 1
MPILGIDFLRKHQLLVDIVGAQLLPRKGAARGGETVNVVNATPDIWSSILAEYPAVSRPLTVSSPPLHGVEHQIVTEGRPVTSKFCRLDTAKLATAKVEFQKMLDSRVIRRSDSCWASPLHMVRKKDGGWQPCGDFRRLNVITTDDKYPLPNMGDLSSRLDVCTIFTKLDLQKGYFQVPVAEKDIKKTAIITPFGLYKFTRMPFGLKNAGMSFQRLMDRLFLDLPFVFVYLDDMLIASKSAEQHQQHLRSALQRLQQNGLILKTEKCVWAQQSLEFLGHNVSAAGISPLSGRVEAITNFPRPQSIQQLQAYLGLFNF